MTNTEKRLRETLMPCELVADLEAQVVNQLEDLIQQAIAEDRARVVDDTLGRIVKNSTGFDTVNGKRLRHLDIDVKKFLGQKIKEARKQKGVTQRELGVLLDYSPMGISHFEKGIRELKTSDLQKMSEYFGKPMSYFMPTTTFFRAESANSNDALKSVKDFESFLDNIGQ